MRARWCWAAWSPTIPSARSAGTDSIPISSGSSLVSALVSDASTEDWATIGVKVQSVALVPQGGGDPVVLYSAAPPVPTTNLVQLDQLSELLGQARRRRPGSLHRGRSLLWAAIPGDVTLVSGADPSTAFPDLPATAIPSARNPDPGHRHYRQPDGAGDGGLRFRPGRGRAASRPRWTWNSNSANPAFLVDHRTPGDPAAGLGGELQRHRAPPLRPQAPIWCSAISTGPCPPQGAIRPPSPSPRSSPLGRWPTLRLPSRPPTS